MFQLHELNEALDEIETEPQTQSKLLKIKKAIESDYKKGLLENVDRKEVDLLKVHFERLLEDEDADLRAISVELDKYIDESDHQPYSDVVERIKEELEEGSIEIPQFEEFMKSFVDQNYPIDVFYKQYFKRSPVRTRPTEIDIFGEEISTTESESSSSSSSSSDEEEDEESKLARVRERVEQTRVEPKTAQQIEPIPEKRVQRSVRGPKVPSDQPFGLRSVVALVKESPMPKQRIPEPKPVADKVFFETMADLTKQDCEFLYKKMPWVKDIINHIYVHPIEGDFEGVVDYTRSIMHDNVEFYYPKENYYNIQCQSTKVQRGDELTVLKNNKTYKLIVAIDTNTKGIVIQNEDMLKAEIDYIRIWNQNKEEHIKELKRNEPNEEIVLLAKYDLSNTLQDAITGNVPIAYRSPHSQFIETVVHTILKNSKTGESFVRLLANIIVFLKIDLSFVNSSVFIKKLREQIYLPGTLPFLTDADKLPEIFMVKNVPENTKTFVLEKLNEERVNFVRDFFENLYIGSSTLRKPTRPILWNRQPTAQIELPDIKSICKNREQVEDENDEDIVFYTDLDEVYCFNVYKLYELFKQEQTPVNPYTRRPFSAEFIQLFLTRYASKPLVKKIERTVHVDLLSKLENLIETELTLIENTLIETEKPDIAQALKKSEEEYPQPTTKKRISRVPPTTDKACFECKKALDDKKITSIFKGKPVGFCDYACLEKNKAFK